jgi:aminoglycoside phosphotransferase (APT) family kinase protein
MSGAPDTFAAGLQALVQRVVPGAQRIAGLQRLSAGATLQTWSFDAVGDDLRHPLILRRSPGGLRGAESLPLPLEAALIRALAGCGAPMAEVVHTLVPADGLGDGFLMTRIAGETIPRKILRDADYAAVRPRLVAQMGAALGAIHRVDTAALPTLPLRPPAATLAALQRRNEALPAPSAVFDFALRWLHAHRPADPPVPRLVHGDFRIGNLIVGPGSDGGLRAVLDWEIAHLGDPAEDLAWICLPPWRFGQIDRPVAGLGSRGALFDAWQAATGEVVDPARVRWWQALGSLRWGLGCAGMRGWFEGGGDPSVERAMIARRVSENELDLLRLLASEDAHA